MCGASLLFVHARALCFALPENVGKPPNRQPFPTWVTKPLHRANPTRWSTKVLGPPPTHRGGQAQTRVAWEVATLFSQFSVKTQVKQYNPFGKTTGELTCQGTSTPQTNTKPHPDTLSQPNRTETTIAPALTRRALRRLSAWLIGSRALSLGGLVAAGHDASAHMYIHICTLRVRFA